MREKLFEIIEPADEGNLLSRIYDYGVILSVCVSMIPLMFKEDTKLFILMDQITVSIFIIDYVLRFFTADFKYQKKSIISFLRYPFSPMAIIDLMSILPSLTALNSGFKLFRLLRMARAVKVLKVFKAFRYSKNIRIILGVLRQSRNPLLAVCVLAGGYILISALVVFNVEPDTFTTFFDALYWATVSLTTVGYGDIYPVTAIGRVITMISSMFGIAIVALPAGIITAGFMKEIESHSDANI